MDELLLRRRMLNMFRDEYIVFADPNVEQICATNWGDGTKITKKQAAAVTSLNGVFKNNTTITSFDEFVNFNKVQNIASNEFSGCTALTSITIPNSVKTIGTYAFNNCTALTSDLNFPNVTSVGDYAFQNCHNVNSITIKCGGNGRTFNAAARNGTLTVGGNLTGMSYVYVEAKDVIINGNVTNNQTMFVFNQTYNESIRIGGNLISNYGRVFGNFTTRKIKFIEIMGTFSLSTSLFANAGNGWVANSILHLGYNGIAGAPDKICAGYSNLTKIYVGDGSSQAADQAVLDQYLANSSWASYASKLDLWYNYNGEYKNS